MKKKKALLLLFITLMVVIIVSAILIVTYVIKLGSAWQPVINDFEIPIPGSHESVFVKTKIWGVSYDHQLLLISSKLKDNFEYDNKTDYIYKDFTYLFYRVRRDSLEIYTMTKSPIPDLFNSNIKIIQVELTNPEMMELMDTYESKGLKKFE